MPREKFEHDLHRLQDEILELGAMAERAIAESVQTLKNKDISHARSLIEADKLINEKRYTIENEALTLIATQQPMAGDLRHPGGDPARSPPSWNAWPTTRRASRTSRS